MNNDIMIPSNSKKRGIVTNFSRFSPQMLHSMKCDIGLTMSVGQLIQLQGYYARIIRRDPSLDELYMLDRLIQLRLQEYSGIDNIFTDNRIIAQTYADLMSKKNAIEDSSMPTLRSLCGIASEYLNSIGKKTALSCKISAEHGKFSEALLYANGCSDPITHLNISVGCVSIQAPQPGALMIMVSRFKNMSEADFSNALSAFIAQVRQSIISCSPIERDGIIGTVCRLTSGAFIDIDSLPIRQPAELEDICSVINDCFIITVAADNVSCLIQAANNCSLCACVIGSITSDNRLSIRYQNSITLSHTMEFIRTLSPNEAIDINPDSAFEHHISPSYPPSSARTCTNDIVMVTHRSEATFSDALCSVIRAISDCVACGVSYKDICLSLETVLNSDLSQSAKNARALSCILGAYRAQIEYYLPDIHNRISFSDIEASHFSVSAIAPMPKMPCERPDGLDGYSLYLLCPDAAQHGLVKFEQLRRMWNYITTLIRSNDIVYAAAVSSAGLDATLKNIMGANEMLLPSDAVPLASDVPTGGIVVVTDVKLDGFFLGNIKSNTI